MKKSTLLGLLAGSMAGTMLGDHLPMPERRRQYLLGNQGWGHQHDPKVKKWRAKEKRAKQARKLNWPN